MKFNINDYKGEYAMHCKTEEEVKIFCRYLNSIGKKWCSGTSYSRLTIWDNYKEQTCYEFNKGAYSDKSFYEDSGYKILEFSDFEWDEMTPKHIFKVGDRVRCIDGLTKKELVGKMGTVIDITGIEGVFFNHVLVEFDEYINGHDGIFGTKGKDGHCWWLPKDKFELVNTNTKRKPVIIYQNGQEVVALDKETGEKAVAKCHPDDTFDFEVGAKLAFDRLYPKFRVDDRVFKVGDRVRCTKSYEGNDEIVNKTGKIIEIYTDNKVVVEFDRFIGGHSGNSCADSSKGKKGHCWIVPKKHLILENVNLQNFIQSTAQLMNRYPNDETEDTSKINVGDYVTIVSDGLRYTTYAEWVTKNAPEYAAYYAYDNDVPLVADVKLKVVAKAPHGVSDEELVLVKKASGICFLYDIDGVKKCN